jgi:hypothetical protein
MATVIGGLTGALVGRPNLRRWRAFGSGPGLSDAWQEGDHIVAIRFINTIRKAHAPTTS